MILRQQKIIFDRLKKKLNSSIAIIYLIISRKNEINKDFCTSKYVLDKFIFYNIFTCIQRYFL